MLAILITSTVILLLVCSVFFIIEYVSFKRSLIYQTQIVGEMCAANTTAALAFGNPSEASEVLQTLEVDPNIVLAVLLNRNDSIFATYPPDASTRRLDLGEIESGIRFRNSRVEGSIPVVQEGNRLGTLYIQSSMGAIYARLGLYGLVALGVITGSMIISYLLSRLLEYNVSRSILSLARTAKIISNEKDYTIRATRHDNDEVGALTTAFNDMLSEIEKQNEEIMSLNQNLETKVRNRTEELESAYNEMEAFSYTVSHDLNAPLRKIDTFIELYLSRNATLIDGEGQKTLQKITGNVKKMRQLITDLLAFSQLGKKELVRTEVDMKQMVQSVFDDYKKQEEGRKIEFNVCDLPAGFADAATINQVWINFISNALKYTRHRDVAKIEVCYYEMDDAIVYYVRDNGVGFDMKDCEKLFAPFQRLHTAKDFDGTGVGLAIVQRIISKHGGKVWAEAIPNTGATFFFSLPKG